MIGVAGAAGTAEAPGPRRQPATISAATTSAESAAGTAAAECRCMRADSVRAGVGRRTAEECELAHRDPGRAAEERHLEVPSGDRRVERGDPRVIVVHQAREAGRVLPG